MARYNRFIAPTKKGSNKKPQLMSVIIPVAGVGYRMKSYGPKCLLRVNEKETIIEKIIHNVNTVFSKDEIIVCVGFEADKIIRKIPDYVRIVENQLYKETNTVESLRLAINNCTSESILIIHGDLVFNPKTIQSINKKESSIIVDSSERFKDDEIGVTIVDNKVTTFAYGLPTKWAQIAYLTGEELYMFKKECSDRSKNKMDTFEILNNIVKNNGTLKAIEPREMEIYEVDAIRDLQ